MTEQRQKAINDSLMNALLTAGIREAVIVCSPNEDPTAIQVAHIAIDYQTVLFTTMRQQLIKDMQAMSSLQRAAHNPLKKT